MISNTEDLSRGREAADRREHKISSLPAIEQGARGFEVILHGRLGDFFAEMIQDGRACGVACGLTEIGALVSLRQKLLTAYSSDSIVVKKVDDRMRQLLHLTPQ
jgi:hypothetical protein